jgi:hypothetical protein
MKRMNYLIPFLVIALFPFFCSCEKLSDSEKQEIERYQKSFRDPQLIGQWEFRDEKNEAYLLIYTTDGLVDQARAIYNDKRELITYKRDKMEVYFYTDDNVIYQYIVNRGTLGTSYSSSVNYSIEKDTLLLNSNTKGIRVNVKIEN